MSGSVVNPPTSETSSIAAEPPGRSSSTPNPASPNPSTPNQPTTNNRKTIGPDGPSSEAMAIMRAAAFRRLIMSVGGGAGGLGGLTGNASTTLPWLERGGLWSGLLDPRRDIDAECGYPNSIIAVPVETYKQLYDREPIANRVVAVLPKETWQVAPTVYEDESGETATEFEQAWDDLEVGTVGGSSWHQDEKGSTIWEYLQRADILSGIGSFGVILLGVDDGRDLQEPIDGAVTVPEGYNPQGSISQTGSITKPQGSSGGYGPEPGAFIQGTDEQYSTGSPSRSPADKIRDSINRIGRQDQGSAAEIYDGKGRPINDKGSKGSSKNGNGSKNGKNGKSPTKNLASSQLVTNRRAFYSDSYMCEEDEKRLENMTVENGATYRYVGLDGEEHERKVIPLNKTELRIIANWARQREFVVNAQRDEEERRLAYEYHIANGTHYPNPPTDNASRFRNLRVEGANPSSRATDSSGRDFIESNMFAPTDNKVSESRDSMGNTIFADPYKSASGVNFSSAAGYGLPSGVAMPAGALSGTDQQYFGVQFGPSEKISDAPASKKRKLLFLRCFDESLVQIVRYEWNVNNPRFGMPVMYRITLNDPREQHSGVGLPLATVFVHWSRVIHIIDNHQTAGTSEIFSPPRMRAVLNRLLDLRKIYAGDGEGYWRTVVAKMFFETHPQLGGDVTVDVDALKDMMEDIENGMQRWGTLMGMSAKSLPIDLKDPTPHVAAHLEAICIQIGCPIRVFKGSERGELASSQDDSKWLDVLRHRQQFYVTPKIIVPFIDRLITIGVLPEPKGYSVEWPSLDSVSEKDKAGIALSETQALVAYAGGNVESFVPPHNFLTKVMGWEDEEADDCLDAAKEAHENEEVMTQPPMVAGQPAEAAEGTQAAADTKAKADQAKAHMDALKQTMKGGGLAGKPGGLGGTAGGKGVPQPKANMPPIAQPKSAGPSASPPVKNTVGVDSKADAYFAAMMEGMR